MNDMIALATAYLALIALLIGHSIHTAKRLKLVEDRLTAALETERDGTTTKAAHTNESLSSPSTIAELKSEIAALKCQLETLSREKDDKIAVIDSDRAQLQRQLEEAKKTATKLIREKLESLQKDIKCSAETHAKETGSTSIQINQSL